MQCAHCHRILKGGNNRTALNDDGSLAITALMCVRCGGVTEEIHILSGMGRHSVVTSGSSLDLDRMTL